MLKHLLQILIFAAPFLTETQTDYLVALVVGAETEMFSETAASNQHCFPYDATSPLLQIAQGSLNEPAYTLWNAMHEYARSKGNIWSKILNVFQYHNLKLSETNVKIAVYITHLLSLKVKLLVVFLVCILLNLLHSLHSDWDTSEMEGDNFLETACRLMLAALLKHTRLLPTAMLYIK